ncbi:putative solute carrier family 22 member 3 [Apostichopus japonicus]|uniref:Putative solute carrier family 22 member 3 n=1 Tax=Stichopus japonicus TaxID=307972 RepID=A0A2G8L0E8_STIJA|nr:putative solute carrier family 22 member 3 [Apostichopus japonicus]
MEIDDIIRSVGDFGRGHMFIFVCICLITQFTASWHIFAITFIGASPSHHCTVHTAFEIDEYIPVDVDNEGEAIFSSCTQYTQPGGPSNATSVCQNGWTYSETPYGTTIVTEWDLVCDRGHLSAFSQSVMMFGVIVGAFIFGYISDRVGRKRVLTVALLCQGCLGVLEAFSPTYIFFVIVRFFMGIFDQGYQLPGYTMTSEMFTPKRRPYAFTMLLNFWAAGILTFPILAFFIQDWRTLQIVISVPFFLFHLIAWFIPESPRWLISVGRYKEATNVFAKIARLNGRKIDPMTMKPQQFVDNGIDNKAFDNCDENVTNVGSGRTINTISQDTNDEEKAQENPKSIAGNNTFIYLFRTRRMTQVTIVMMVLWFVSSLAYYGVSLNSVELAGDPYLNLFLCGAVEIPSHWLSAFLSIWYE